MLNINKLFLLLCSLSPAWALPRIPKDLIQDPKLLEFSRQMQQNWYGAGQALLDGASESKTLPGIFRSKDSNHLKGTNRDGTRWSLYRIGADLVHVEAGMNDWARVGIIDSAFDSHARWLQERTVAAFLDTLPALVGWSHDHGTHVCGVVSMIGDFAAPSMAYPKICLATYAGPKTVAKIRAMYAASGQVLSPLALAGEVEGHYYQESLAEQLQAVLSDPLVKVVSASLTYGSNGGWGEIVTELLKDRQAIFVNSAGNNSEVIDGRGNRSASDATIFIGATDAWNNLASFSNHGSGVFMTAPGVDVESFTTSDVAGRDPQVGMMSGTSMAAPHVAGVLSLVWTVAPQLTRGEIREILKKSATDLGAPGFDAIYGHGLLNAPGAMAWARAYAETKNWQEAEAIVINESKLHFERAVELLGQALESKNSDKSIMRQASREARLAFFLRPAHRPYRELVFLTEFASGAREDLVAAALMIESTEASHEFASEVFRAWIEEPRADKATAKALKHAVITNHLQRHDVLLWHRTPKLVENLLHLGVDAVKSDLPIENIPLIQRAQLLGVKLTADETAHLLDAILGLNGPDDRDAAAFLLMSSSPLYRTLEFGPCATVQSYCGLFIKKASDLPLNSVRHRQFGFLDLVSYVSAMMIDKFEEGLPNDEVMLQANALVDLLSAYHAKIPSVPELERHRSTLMWQIRDFRSDRGLGVVAQESPVSPDLALSPPGDIWSSPPTKAKEWVTFFSTLDVSSMSESDSKKVLGAWSKTSAEEQAIFWRMADGMLGREQDQASLSSVHGRAIEFFAEAGDLQSLEVARRWVASGSIEQYRAGFDVLLKAGVLSAANVLDIVTEERKSTNINSLSERLVFLVARLAGSESLRASGILTDEEQFKILEAGLAEAAGEITRTIYSLKNGIAPSGRVLENRWRTSDFFNAWAMNTVRDALHEVATSEGVVPKVWLDACIANTLRSSALANEALLYAVNFEFCSHVFQMYLQLNSKVLPAGFSEYETWLSFATQKADARKGNFFALMRWSINNRDFVAAEILRAFKADASLFEFRPRPGIDNGLVSEEFQLDFTKAADALITTFGFPVRMKTYPVKRSISVQSPSGFWFEQSVRSLDGIDDSGPYQFLRTDLSEKRNGPSSFAELGRLLFSYPTLYSRFALYLSVLPVEEVIEILKNITGPEMAFAAAAVTDAFVGVGIDVELGAQWRKKVFPEYRRLFVELRKADPVLALRALESMVLTLGMGSDENAWFSRELVMGFAEATSAPLINAYFEKIRKYGGPACLEELRNLNVQGWEIDKLGQRRALIKNLDSREAK